MLEEFKNDLRILQALEKKKEYLDKAIKEIESYSSVISDFKKLKLSVVIYNEKEIGILDFKREQENDKFFGFRFDLKTLEINIKNNNELESEQFQATLKILNKLKSEKL